MPTSQPPEQRFCDLSLAEQLFIWTVRHLVYAREMQRSICPQVNQAFVSAGVNSGVTMISRLLQTLAETADRAVLVNVPSGLELLYDETRLLSCLRSTLVCPQRCACYQLQEIAGPQGRARLVAEFRNVARLLLAHGLVSGSVIREPINTMAILERRTVH